MLHRTSPAGALWTTVMLLLASPCLPPCRVRLQVRQAWQFQVPPCPQLYLFSKADALIPYQVCLPGWPGGSAYVFIRVSYS